MNPPRLQIAPRPQITRAVLWMIGAIAAFSTMAVAGRKVSIALDTFEIMLYRSLGGLVIVVVIVTLTGKWGQISRRSMGLQLVRNLAHFSGQNLWFFAITVIPLAQVFALEFTSPIWVVVLAPLLLRERLTSTRVLSAVMGLIGILIIVRPSPETMNAGIIAAAIAAFFFAITGITTKKLTQTESIACILFWLTAIQLVLATIIAGYDGNIALPDAQTAPWLLLIAIAGLTAHFCLTNALAIAPATVVIPIDFARLPVIAIIGMILYNEALEIWVFVGAAIIFIGNYLNILAETRKTPS